jgi:hypothetical protein
MWFERLILAAAGLAAATAALQWFRRRSRSSTQVDGGQVSESWLAEHRAGRSDSLR